MDALRTVDLEHVERLEALEALEAQHLAVAEAHRSAIEDAQGELERVFAELTHVRERQAGLDAAWVRERKVTTDRHRTAMAAVSQVRGRCVALGRWLLALSAVSVVQSVLLIVVLSR